MGSPVACYRYANTAICKLPFTVIYLSRLFTLFCNFHVRPENVKFQIINQSGYSRSMANRMENGIVQNMDWTGLDNWTGQLDWTIGLDSWTGLLDWTVGLDYWTGFRMGFFPLNRRNLTDSKVYGMFLRKTK